MRHNNRRGTLGVRKLRALLTPRDEAILRSFDQHTFLTTNHLQAFHFWNHASAVSAIRACTRVLARLEGHGLIRRLSRTVGGYGGGSASTVWSLAAAGERVARVLAGRAAGKRSRPAEPGLMFLKHSLAVADVHIEFERLARTERINLLEVSSEPTNWRRFVTSGGGVQILKPDLFAVSAGGEFEDSWFLEIDRGTESLPTLLRKCHVYQRHHDSGREQQERGVYPLVVWLIDDVRRRRRLREAIEGDRALNPQLFRVIGPPSFGRLVTSTESLTHVEFELEEGGTHE